ncbi:ArnT family glycosyltransferase [Anianabacter salinae]|uniref:ArnT family glycosyltransferase n=1 Tax=Anianabacter salinae TaxID=2851023 RepID=UPI00225E0233|nr:glycosyltransferase family 39 protein [Anianabacter salinae]MBV0913628.1 glycosyltransferase family 39 protein [Anianabacter salinae]
MGIPRAAWVLFAALMAARALLAWLLPLGWDETYAIAVARDYSLSFSDHPPLGFWAPVFAADLTGIEHAFVYRLPALVFGAGTFWGLYGIGYRLGGDRVALWTGALFAVTPIFTVLFGFMAVPDSPLGCFAALAVLALLTLIERPYAGLWLWLAGGAALGLALMSKYHAGLFALSILVFALASRTGRGCLVRPGFWLAVGVALLGLLPVLAWNIGNDWASFGFHSGRTSTSFQPANFSKMLAIQTVMLLPPVALLCLRGLIHAGRRRDPALGLVAAVALGPILAFSLVFALTPLSFAHWTMPGWLFAIPLAALWLSHQDTARVRRNARWVAGFAIPFWLLVPVFLLHVHTGLLTRFTHDTAPLWDDTRSVFDYAPLRGALAERGLLEGTDVLVAREWIEGGVFSTALHGAYPVRLIEGDLHHFRYLPGMTATGETLALSAHLIPDAGAQAQAFLSKVRQLDAGATLHEPVILTRGGRPYLNISVVSLTLR